MRKTNKQCSVGKSNMRVFSLKTSMLSLILFFWLIPNSVHAQELKVAVASNFYHALSTLTRQFEQETGITVKLSSGASGLLYAQIIRGAPFDLFFSADIERPELLEQKGLTSVRNTYVYGRLALWSPTNNASEQNVLTHKTVVDEQFLSRFDQRLAIANPLLAPYGKAAKQTLEHLGLNQRFNSKLILGNNINQTYQFVDSGNALAGFVAYSLLKNKAEKDTKDSAKYSTKDKTDYWLVPQSFHQPIAQQVVLIKKSKNKKEAQALLNFILSESAQQTLLTMGYSIVEDAVVLGKH